MAGVLKFCKVLSLPETLIPDAVYMVKDGDSVVIYVTDDYSTAYPFRPGASAYGAAVALGFVGTEAEWVSSLQGEDGLSAYQVAVENGFVGTEAEWLQSLEYDPGYTPQDSAKRETDGTLASNSDDFFPSTKAARTFIQAAANDAEVAAKNYADSLIASALNLRGGHDASGNAYPTTGGSGSGGAIKAGNLWFVSVPGVLSGKPVVVGDSFFAVTNSPGQTAANWCVLDTNLGFVPEEAGTAAAAIAAHLAANDPHGDRAAAIAAIAAHAAAPDPHGDRAYADLLVATPNTIINTSGAIATSQFINRLDHFIGNEDSTCFTASGFNNYFGWSDTLRGNITGANAWRGVATHQVTTTAGQRRFNFGGGYAASVAGSASANLHWVAGDKYQFIWRGAISAVPDGSNRFCLTFGFSTRGSVDGYSPSVTAGYSHALIWADESSGFWKCSSRSAVGESEQTTVTAVAVAAMTEITIHVVIAATGNVEFYINNSLVATHSGSGKIQAGDELIPQFAWNNKATIAATRYLYSDCVGYLLAFGSQAAGLAWR